MVSQGVLQQAGSLSWGGAVGGVPVGVSALVQRWQTLSGKMATLEGDGRTFEDISDARKKEAA